MIDMDSKLLRRAALNGIGLGSIRILFIVPVGLEC